MTYATLQIINTVCKVFAVGLDEIQTSSKQSMLDSRAAMALLMIENGIPSGDVAVVLRRNHSMTAHYLKRAWDLLEIYPAFAINVNECRRRIKEMLCET